MVAGRAQKPVDLGELAQMVASAAQELTAQSLHAIEH
jgi:hypothetical protein